MNVDTTFRRMRSIAALVVLFSARTAPAQIPFTKAFFDQDSLLYNGVHVLMAQNGDIVLLSDLGWLSNTNNRFRFIRMNSYGQVLSHNDIVQTTTVAFFDMNDVVELPDGSFAIAGAYGWDVMLVRITAQGVLIDAHTYPFGTISYANTIDMENDSTLALAGGALMSGGNTNTYVVRTELDGTLMNAEYHRLEQRSSYARCSAPASDGGLYFCGNSADTVATTNVFQKNIMLLRTDDAGAPIWARRVLCSGYSSFVSGIEQLSSGNLLLAGYHAPNQGYELPFLIKLDAMGHPIWGRYYPPINGGYSQVRDMDLTSDQRVVASGFSDYGAHWMILDTNGTVVQSRYMPGLSNAPSVAAPVIGGAVIAVIGQSPLLGVAPGVAGLDVFLDPACDFYDLEMDSIWMTLGEAGTDQIFPVTTTAVDFTADLVNASGLLSNFDPCFTTLTQGSGDPLNLTLWPNPATSLVHVVGSAIDRIDLLDMTGRTIWSHMFNGDQQLEEDIGWLSSGAYQLRVKDRGIWYTERLLKQ